jgi:hypothetical protein
VDRGGGVKTPAEHELVFALCHEVGNLLAGVRLQADLLRSQEGLRLASHAARAGSLVGLVRPLLDERRAACPVDPVALLEGLRRDVDPSEPVEIEPAAAQPLPALAGDAEALHHLLLAELRAALERAHEAGSPGVRLSCQRTDDGADLCVESAGGVADDEPPERLSGAALTRALAVALLARWGGRVRVSGGAGRARIVYSLRAVGRAEAGRR